MIEVEHVCLSFGKRKILEDVNLTVYDGETMVILGASGSGKSTLLKLIIGLLKPDSGSIKVNGEKISSLTEREMNEERRRMGMVFQYSALFDSMNVKENVAFWSSAAHRFIRRRNREYHGRETAFSRLR